MSLQDQWEISDLLYRYAAAVDSRDANALADCFTSDMVLAGPGFELREHVIDGVMAGLQPFVWTQHNLFNPRYRIDGDRAEGTVNCIASHVLSTESGHEKLDWYIQYHDQLQRVDGQWRLSQRRLQVEWTSRMPVQPPGQ